METVLITGANRGIGLALTRRFIDGGYHVYATCREPENAGALAALGTDANLTICPLEVTDEQSVEELQSLIAGRSLDILINNAGVIGGDHQGVTDMDYGAWREAFEVNTMAPFRMTTALRSNLQKASKPRVITLSSQMGALSLKSKGAVAYRSSKAAVNKVMQILSLELEQDGIIVCPVHPGWVQTDMGGGNADIPVEQSAEGLFGLIEGLTPTDSGRFWTWDGQEHPW